MTLTYVFLQVISTNDNYRLLVCDSAIDNSVMLSFGTASQLLPDWS